MSKLEWIKCEDQMPAPNVEVLVSYRLPWETKEFVLGASRQKAFVDMEQLFWFNGKGEGMRGTVSHWMPMIPLDFQAYPISHGTHIIQFHDETFVWYDEAGLQGGVEYSLQAAERDLKRYGEWLNSTAPALQPITQPGYAPGEIPHHLGDLTDYAVKLQKQNIDLWVFMAQARDLLSMTQRHVKNPTLEKAIEAFLAMTASPAEICEHCGWPHINTTETCDDATARERGNHV